MGFGECENTNNLTLNKTNVGAAAAAWARTLGKRPPDAARARRAPPPNHFQYRAPSLCSHASKRPPTKPRRRASNRGPSSRRRSRLIKRWLWRELGRRSPGEPHPALSELARSSVSTTLIQNAGRRLSLLLLPDIEPFSASEDGPNLCGNQNFTARSC